MATVHALQAEVAALKARVRQQQDTIEALQDALDEAAQNDDNDEGDELDVSDDLSADGLARQMLRAAKSMQKAQPGALALARAVQSLAGATRFKLDALPHAKQPAPFAARDAAIPELRRSLTIGQQVVNVAQAILADLLVPPPATSRAGQLLSLGELIGPHPGHSWRDEWVPLNVEAFGLSGKLAFANEQHVRCNDTPERVQGNFQATIDGLVQRGWDQKSAEDYCLLGSASNAICLALRERSSRFVAGTYAICDALWTQHNKSTEAPLPFYWFLRGPQGLVEDDPAWEQLEEPDATGFCGLTCASLVLVERVPYSFTETGLRVRVTGGAGKVSFHEMDSDIVCFESSVDDEFGSHCAVLTTSGRNGAFPPNTQFQLKDVKEAGTWAAPRAADEQVAPVYPKQRLLVVTATFHSPQADVTGKIAQRLASSAPKLCCGAVSLAFGRREAYLAGLDGLTSCPLYALADEFGRELLWTDSHGVSHSLIEQWEYVNGTAQAKEVRGMSATRDAGHAGMTPDAFLREANERITKRRKAGLGSLPERYALLSMDEVLAVRLFTGPAHMPINDFLRTAATATGEQRMMLARHATSTFAATVCALCAAIRKLADVALPDEIATPLYLGIRGGLHRSERCAVSTAFLSSSRERAQPINHMQREGGNVLWKLMTAPSDNSGHHRGADVSFLSQFPAEAEVVFPPGTMLTMIDEPRNEVTEDSNKPYKAVAALPTFL